MSVDSRQEVANLSKQVKIAAIWNVLKLVVNRGGTAIVMLVLAAHVGPDAFGLFAVVMVFREVARVLATSGLNEAVIRETTVTDVGLDSVFWFNIAFALLLYGLILLAAPFIATLYGNAQLVPLLRVTCLVFVFDAIKVIPVANLSRALEFRSQAFAETAATVVSSFVAFGAAYVDWGIWSLVALVVSKAVVSALALVCFSGWIPKCRFSWSAFRPYWRFGKNLLVANLLGRFSKNAYALVLGAVFSTQIAGFYYLGYKIEQIIGQSLSNVLNQAVYPALAKFKDNNAALRERIERVLRIQVLLISLAALLSATLAPIAIPFFMGPEWSGAVIYVQLLAIVASIYPINVVNVKAMSVKGRSDYMLWLGILRSSLRFALMFAAIPFGAVAVILSQVLFMFIAWGLNAWVNRGLIGYGLAPQMNAVWKMLVSAVIVAAGVLIAENYLELSYSFLALFVFASAGTTAYLLLCVLFREPTSHWLLSSAVYRVRP